MLYLQDPCHPLELVRRLCHSFCGCRLAGAQWRGLRGAGCGVWRGNSRTRGGLRGGTPQVAPPVHTRHQTCRPASSSGCVADRQLILSVDFICLLCDQVNMTVVGSSYTARPASSSASVPATGPQFSGETTKSSKGIIFYSMEPH